MTVYRKDPDAISNWFNKILDGIGKDGSSFTDIDWLAVAALTHDRRSRRFLFQEFKRPNEDTSSGQWQALYDLSRQPNTTVWLARQVEGLKAIELTIFHEAPPLEVVVITPDSYRQLFADWWNQTPKPADAIPPRIVWAEYIHDDPSLQTFVAAEIARANIELDTAKYNEKHWRQVAARLDEDLTLAKKARIRS